MALPYITPLEELAGVSGRGGGPGTAKGGPIGFTVRRYAGCKLLWLAHTYFAHLCVASAELLNKCSIYIVAYLASRGRAVACVKFCKKEIKIRTGKGLRLVHKRFAQ